MRTFKQFLIEREDLYKISDEELEKSQGHDHNIKLTNKQIDFLKKHLPTCPKAKKNKSLIATLNKSKDFIKVQHVVPQKKK